MATEKGIVVKTGKETAWVRTLPDGACDGCPSCGSCSAQRQEAEVEVINTVGAKVGDRIMVDLQTSAFLKATFLLYVFPILGLTAGAVLGNASASRLGLDPSAASALMGFGAFFLAVGIVRVVGQGMARKPAYRPRITKVLPPLGPAAAPPGDCRV
jgi:sigma-E factor negative regulatory protein RseC